MVHLSASAKVIGKVITPRTTTRRTLQTQSLMSVLPRRVLKRHPIPSQLLRVISISTIHQALSLSPEQNLEIVVHQCS